MTNAFLFKHQGGRIKKNPPSQPSLPLAEERVIERLSDDRVSTNKATLPLMHGGDYSPRLRYAGRPSLRCAERGQRNFNASTLI
ncbi:MAG: hypothetical protein JWR23_134 [Mucilaginibacter sp.]|nr:hypothetical protein [Mucilaginibacter sp.]